jgi:hypothetical protein
MDPTQGQEMNEQFEWTNCKPSPFYLRNDLRKLLGTGGPPRVQPGVQYPTILPTPPIYETRMSYKCPSYLEAANSDLLW